MARGVTKAFGPTVAVAGITLGVRAGEVHAVAGANGSGKSTLIKILTGVHGQDEGDLLLDGEVQNWSSPADSRRAGVGVVHQEAPLVEKLTVAECVDLLGGYPSAKQFFLSNKAARVRTQKLLDEHEVPVDARELCSSLSPAERAMVSLAVAMDQGSRVLILDEVTAALPQDEADQVLALVRRLADRGCAVLMITHRLDEIERYADRTSVLTAGRLVYSGATGEISAEQIIEHMLPEEGAQEIVSSGEKTAGGQVLITVRDLAGQRLAPLSFEVRAGEILGFAGLPDAGIDDLAMLLCGGVPGTGTLTGRGRTANGPWTPSAARRAGLALVPRDRLTNGAVALMTITDNVALPDQRRYWHRTRARRATVRDVITELDVRPADPGLSVGNLSGGNQQKVILGKWLATRPDVLVLDDPTNGVDPAARLRMFAAVRARVDDGAAAILLSSEVEQLTTYCDRVLVLRPGRPAEELTAPDNPTHLARLMAQQ
ncbi:sugar ABC transporter ATP-binding protein [Actinoplanes bogorensis]|uniref:Sugar ABC transporter ATP-binding protein n=1 Tax=Paractinoplanes bogorensis TaxID=1610840 RepID=A0ABS5YZL5_9ACTN|nr:sugar ABC transporter ATP-binding protein [Actinoplanes bogorensis]MBU2668889.1 sugar ABC transporter ATP-binding protein [Actinoplanes bogorensis]